MMRKAYTLLEVLIVIATVAVLLVSIYIVVDPRTRLAQTQERQRELDIAMIREAITQYESLTGTEIPEITTLTTEIQHPRSSGACSGYVDLATPGILSIIRDIPVDPGVEIGECGSGYWIARSDGKIEVGLVREFESIETPPLVSDGLVARYDPGDTSIRESALYYRWFTTPGGNPTNKAAFDAFFAGTPQESGLDADRSIDWLVLEGRPSYVTSSTNFAWEVTGLLIITEPGDYIFNTRSDDGNELQVDGQILTSFYGGRAIPNPGDISATITLAEGVYPFQYRMQQGAVLAGAQVRWQRPSSASFEVIPAANFAVNLDYNVLVDITGNTFDGTLVNGVAFESASGGTLVFDGVDDYVTTKNQLDPTADGLFTDASSAWTVSSWFLPDTSNANPGVIVGKSSDISNTATFVVYTEGTNLRARLRGGTVFTISSSLTDTWNEVAITWDGSVARTFLNGQEVNTMSVGSAAKQTNNVVIGATGGGTNTHYSGNIAETKVYDRGLTPDEVLQNFNATRSRYGL